MNDLDRQWERLKNNRRLNSTRNRIVNQAYASYQRNILATKSASSGDRKMVEAYSRGDFEGYQKLRDKVRNRQYSRNVYMGLGNSGG